MTRPVRNLIAAGRHRRLAWFGVSASADHWDANWSAQDIARAIEGARTDERFLPLMDRHAQRGALVLEAGCGLGQWVTVLRERGYRAIGIDYVFEALRTSTRHSGRNGILARADVRKLPFADGTFDAITSFGVVEHFWGGPEPLIADMVRVLRPGGTMFLSVPYFSPLRKLRTWNARGGTIEATVPEPPAFYQFAFEKKELHEKIRAAGLTVIETVPTSPVKGLKDEVPFFSRLRARVNATEAATPPSAAPAAGAKTRGRKPLSRRLAGSLKTALQRVVNLRPVSVFAGHMIMVVCRKGEA